VSRTLQVSRLLAEIVAIVLLAEVATACLLPLLAPGAGPIPEPWLHGALVVLLAGPIVAWRVRRAVRPASQPAVAERNVPRGTLVLVMIAAIVVGCGVTALAVDTARERGRSEARAQFDRQADRLALETERRVNRAAYGLKGARGVYAASKSVERLGFRAYVAACELAREFPGAMGFGFIERVPRAELDGFQAAVRADDAPDFTIHTAGDAPELYVIRFFDPLERNPEAPGYDLGSEPVRRAAIERAVQSGEPLLTPRLDRGPDTLERAGFLYLVPVYRNGTKPRSASDREEALLGLVFAPLVLEDVLAGAMNAVEGNLELQIYDGSRLDDSKRLYVSDELAGGDREGRMFHDLRQVLVGGRTWSLKLSSTRKFDSSVASDASALVGLTGLLLSALLAYLIWTLGSARARAMALAKEMTADLAAAKHEAERALRDFDALRSTLDEHSIVSVTDARARIIDVNKAFCRISGYAPEELLGQDHRLINSGHHPKSFWIEAWRTISAGRPWRAEICNRAKSGALYWVDTVIAPFAGADGRIERYFAISTDITARKQAEAEQTAALALATELARSSDARQAARAVNDALGETPGFSRTAVLLFEEDGACRFVGWRGLSMEYRRAVEGYCPWKQGETDAVPLVVNDVLTETSLAQHHGVLRKDGIAALAYVPILTEKGVIGMLTLHASKAGRITPARIQAARSAAASLGSAVARLRMAEALSTNERRFRSLVEGADVIVWEFDALGEAFTYVSPQAKRLGYALGDWLVPGFWARHMHPEDRERAVEFCRSESRAGRKHRFQYRMLAADERVIWVENFVSVEKSPTGQMLLRGVMIDITESKQVAVELTEARTRAEAATRAKSEFLANMSHEIRTPLTAILGYSDILREEGDLSRAPERRLQAIDTILGAGHYLLTVINDVLDLSKIEAGKMEVELVETPLLKILTEVADLVRPRAAEKGVELRTRLGTPVHERLMSDPTRLRQILMNLVGNAAKFTESGSVTLIASEEQREGQARLLIDVEDTGPGLSPELASRLFVAFSQADASVTRKHGGTGLGLTICRRLAELMGGTVMLARTMPGQGSCFRVELPLVPAPGAALVASLETQPHSSEPKPALSAARLSGRVLVAEDGRDNQRLIELHLKRAGAEVQVVDNGLIALERIEQAQAEGRPFDLLLTDMQMPEMDGYTLTSTLRQRGSTLAIVALTAHAMPEDRQKCIDAGCDDYSTKPINRNQLIETCARWIGMPGGKPSAKKPA